MLLIASVSAFATLGDDGKKNKQKEASVLLPMRAKNFSLSSNYQYKSNNIFEATTKKQFIMLTPVITYQTGNSAFILPLKRAPFLGKIRFNSKP